jgi:hypothetical protein
MIIDIIFIKRNIWATDSSFMAPVQLFERENIVHNYQDENNINDRTSLFSNKQ